MPASKEEIERETKALEGDGEDKEAEADELAREQDAEA